MVIPSRNEPWLNHTVEDVLTNLRADTEILVIADGAWPTDGLPVHPRVRVIHHATAIGQRAATNEGVRVSRAKFVMKLDAHCAVDEGFDVKLMARCEPDWTVIPAQWNLHIFDWVCVCGARSHQGPTPEKCQTCGATEGFTKDMLWTKRRLTEFWRFDPTLRFQYWGALKHRPGVPEDLAETMSCLGACFFMHRARFHELGGFDEAHGSWGQFGTELACKSWLSGGKMMVNRTTWFAHLFRTQGGDFSFPYPLPGSEVEAARAYSRDLWFNNKWPGQKYPLSWLIEKFAPIPDWPPLPAPVDEPVAPVVHTGPTKGLVYYTDNRGDETILQSVQARLSKVANGYQVVSASLKPMGFGHNVTVEGERGVLTMFRQILAGLEASDAEIVFLVEHDVLYHPSHFAFTPPRDDRYYYNEHTYKVDADTGQAVFYFTKQTSGLCAYRSLLLAHYRARIARVEAEGFTRRMGFEPGTHRTPRGIDDVPAERWMSELPNVDIRHGHNLTASRWSQDQFRDPRACLGWELVDEIPGWGVTKGRFAEFLEDARRSL